MRSWSLDDSAENVRRFFAFHAARSGLTSGFCCHERHWDRCRQSCDHNNFLQVLLHIDDFTFEASDRELRYSRPRIILSRIKSATKMCRSKNNLPLPLKRSNSRCGHFEGGGAGCRDASASDRFAGEGSGSL